MSTNATTAPVPDGPARRGDNRALLLILAVGLQLAVVGAYLAVKTLTGVDHGQAASSAPPEPPPGGYGIASDVRTSFGSVVVGTAQSLPGVTSRALAGASHGGIGGYVPPNKVQVQVTVEISNRLRTPIPYAPNQFTLISGNGKPIAATGASIKAATLLPDAAVEATLIFVVPRKGQKLKLAFKDTGRAAPFLIDLGKVDTTTPKAGGNGDHGTTHP